MSKWDNLKNIIKEKGIEVKDILLDKNLPEPFSGEMNLKHVVSKESFPDNKIPENFEFVKNYEGSRYDGDGGVLGGQGVYLDNSGTFSTKHKNSRWNFDKIYDVNTKFDKALVLTPDNMREVLKRLSINPDTKLKNPEELINKIKSKGYDGLVIEGFQDRDNRFKDLAEKKGTRFIDKWSKEEYPGFKWGDNPEIEKAFYNKTLDKIKNIVDTDSEYSKLPEEVRNKEVQRRLFNHMDDLKEYNNHSASEFDNAYKGLTDVEDITQDQVFAFNPDKLKVIGESKEGIKNPLKVAKPFDATPSSLKYGKQLKHLPLIGSALGLGAALSSNDASAAIPILSEAESLGDATLPMDEDMVKSLEQELLMKNAPYNRPTRFTELRKKIGK